MNGAPRLQTYHRRHTMNACPEQRHDEGMIEGDVYYYRLS